VRGAQAPAPTLHDVFDGTEYQAVGKDKEEAKPITEEKMSIE